MKSGSIVTCVLLSSFLAASASAQSRLEGEPSPVVHAEPGARVRWGANVNVGAFVPQGAAMLGLEGRVGTQLNSSLALIANLSAGFGLGVAARRAESSRVTVVAPLSLGVLAEGTFSDRLSIGAGPALALATWATGRTVGESAEFDMVADGFMPGLDLKLAYLFSGPVRAGARRAGLSIGLDVLMLAAPGARYTAADGSARTALAMGIIPTLMIGYDAR